MAHLHKDPYPGFKRGQNEGLDAYFERTQKKLLELSRRSAEQCRKEETEGVLLRFPVADGYAFYLVVKRHPLTLQHVPFGDAYEISDAHIRGLTLHDVAVQITDQSAQHSANDERRSFVSSLKKGQHIHYHNGFGSYVRYLVTRVTPTSVAIKPVALIGNWDTRDIGQRTRTGEVMRGYHAKEVIAGREIDAMLSMPHERNIYEAKTFNRLHNDIDPRKLEPIPLELHDLTPDEAEKARLWKKVEQVVSLLQLEDKDPKEALKAARIVIERALEAE